LAAGDIDPSRWDSFQRILGYTNSLNDGQDNTDGNHQA